MELTILYAKPSTVLRALTAASHLMAGHDRKQKEAIDELIREIASFIDEQSEEAEKRREKEKNEHDAAGEDAIRDARTVARILIELGGDPARAALGVPPPDPLEQQKLRTVLNPELLDVERAVSGLNSVMLEIDDDADHGVSGKRWVSANIYLPIDWNPATNPMAQRD